MRTHYDVLGVSPSASAEEIRASYRRLVLKYHPDRHQGNPLSELAEAELAALNVAHEVLADAATRAAYDADLAGGRGRPGMAGPPHVTRQARTLAVVLRVVSVIVVVLFGLRFVPAILRGVAEVWQVLAGSLSALGGTAAVMITLAIAALLLVRWARRRKPGATK